MIPVDRRRLLALLAGSVLPVRAWAEAMPLVELPGEVPAPDLALPDLAGTTRRLADHRGRPVLVNFWAVWCPPCRRELAALAELRSRVIAAGIEIFAVNLGDSAERITAFFTDHAAPGLPVLLDGEKSAAVAWHVSDLPVTFAVDPAGILRLGAIGERDWRAPDIERQLRSLL
jgi:thiol-disulfide isomerase/thioredoxin